MNNGISIGKQIKYYRQQKQIKQEELADYLGVSYQAVSKWETGASVPDIALLPQISVYFGVSIDELFQIPYEAEMERIENMMLTERRINDQTFDRAHAVGTDGGGIPGHLAGTLRSGRRLP